MSLLFLLSAFFSINETKVWTMSNSTKHRDEKCIVRTMLLHLFRLVGAPRNHVQVSYGIIEFYGARYITQPCNLLFDKASALLGFMLLTVC